MMIEEYKVKVLYELEKAVDEVEVERIINRAAKQFSEKDLFRKLVVIYLYILQSELTKLSEQNIDSPRKRNIRHALNYLRQMNTNRQKVE